jgi:hypothetical protein
VETPLLAPETLAGRIRAIRSELHGEAGGPILAARLGICPRIRLHPPIAPWAFAGLWPFGPGPALGAHYPLALAPTPQV